MNFQNLPELGSGVTIHGYTVNATFDARVEFPSRVYFVYSEFGGRHSGWIGTEDGKTAYSVRGLSAPEFLRDGLRAAERIAREEDSDSIEVNLATRVAFDYYSILVENGYRLLSNRNASSKERFSKQLTAISATDK